VFDVIVTRNLLPLECEALIKSRAVALPVEANPFATDHPIPSSKSYFVSEKELSQ
jgi:hypothetical protein